MGGICGIFNFDRSPADQSTLEAMAAASSYRGPDGINYLVEGNAGLAHQVFHTTPQSEFEQQPSFYGNSRYILAADARIDNREDLIPQLFPGLAHRDCQNLPDTDIIFAAYMRWGSNCPKSLLGDFTFVIWDCKDQQLFAARDTMGMRPFFYYTRPNRLVIASSIDSILRALDSIPELNLPWIEDFVRQHRRRWIRETIYKDILCLPPAWSLSVSGDTLTIDNYHTFGSSGPPCCKTDEEWISAFRALFDGVVASQLRSSTPVAIHLSSGLDSSSIACTAHDLKENTPIPEIKLASLLYHHTPSADESEFIETVVNHCHGFESLKVYADQFWAFRDFDLSSGFPLEEPDISALRKVTMALFDLGSENGCRVALNGDMGNMVLGDTVYVSPRALQAVPYKRLVEEMKYFKAHIGTSYPKLLAQAYLPQRVIGAYQRLTTSLQLRSPTTSPWLQKRHARHDNGTPTIAEEVHHTDDLNPVGFSVLRHTMTPFQIRRLAFHTGLASFCKMEWRTPYIDRRIVEFLLHLPIRMAVSSGTGRIILRESMRNTVPASIISRQSGGHLGDLLVRGFDKERDTIDGLVRNSILHEMGIINAGELAQWILHHRRSEADSNLAPQLRELYPVLTMENWLQRKFGNS